MSEGSQVGNTSDLQPLSASGEAVRLRVLCPGEQGGASEEVAGGHSVLDGPGAHLPPSLWARGKPRRDPATQSQAAYRKVACASIICWKSQADHRGVGAARERVSSSFWL